jgi:hypothetical protein
LTTLRAPCAGNIPTASNAEIKSAYFDLFIRGIICELNASDKHKVAQQ